MLATIFYHRGCMRFKTLDTNTNFKDKIWHKYLGRPYYLHVTDYGGDGPVIVFLHGLGSSSANWAKLIPLLQAHYRCISVDLIGFGESPKPTWYGYTMEEHLRSIHKTLDNMHLLQPYILVGHSLGSLLATRYASSYGQRISRLILLSPPVYAPLHTIENRSARNRTSMYLRAYKFLRTHPRATPENMQRLGRILPQLKSLQLNTETWDPFIRSLEQCIENQTLLIDIRNVTAPIDIFYGIFDEVIVPYNIRQLPNIRDITLYPLRVNHIIGKRYALAVAKILLRFNHL